MAESEALCGTVPLKVCLVPSSKGINSLPVYFVWSSVASLFIILFALLNVRRAEITLVNSHADWLWLVWEFYIWEAWQQAHVVSTATWSQRVNGAAGSVIKVHQQSSCSRVWLSCSVNLCCEIRAVRNSSTLYVGCNGKLGLIHEQKFFVLLLIPNIVFIDLYWNTKPTTTSRGSSRAPHILRGFNPSLKRTNTSCSKYFFFCLRFFGV